MKTITVITTFKTPATGMANNIPRGPIKVPPIKRTSITAIGWRPTLSPTTSGVIKLLSICIFNWIEASFKAIQCAHG